MKRGEAYQDVMETCGRWWTRGPTPGAEGSMWNNLGFTVLGMVLMLVAQALMVMGAATSRYLTEHPLGTLIDSRPPVQTPVPKSNCAAGVEVMAQGEEMQWAR